MTGLIILWYGPINAIPPGWLLCDGNNDTPDLRNSFILGAGLLWDPDDTGGATTHLHPFITAPHTHFLLRGTDIQGGAIVSGTTTQVQDTGITDTENHLPPYHALAYIIKIGL